MTSIHPFERAGLGSPSYRYCGMEQSVHVAGDVVKSGSSCDFCGTAITFCYWFKGAEGRKFKVGSSCVAKSGDGNLKRAISADKRKHQRELSRARALRLRDEVELLIEDNLELLEQAPHPDRYFASTGKTLVDYIDYHRLGESCGPKLSGTLRPSETGLRKLKKLIARHTDEEENFRAIEEQHDRRDHDYVFGY